ncbi:MAG: aminoglycoside phosphotransferase family protein [Hyphomonas oceanitis]|uniref:aminoglycoside phosphotransferase family protein n=1 Tax=Hyphomonas oceanitis TaxID=81033 RepID=UPI003003649C
MDISEKSTSGPEIDVSLVRSLLDSQFPHWAHLPLTPVASDGTDNVMFRLGADMCVRLPRVARAAGHVDKEQLWLPRLGALPLAIPEPLGHGLADDRYPWNWSVYSWIKGAPATPDQIADMDEAAATLAALLNAFQTVDAADGPPSGAHNEYRGVPLALRDGVTRTSMETLKDEFDLSALTAIWDEALAAPVWSDAPVWIHGDIHSGNLLASNGRLCGLIDFGLTGVGDPACDLMVGWSLLPQSSRAVFRSSLDVDAATWERGRGWALSVALVALAYYRDSNADISERSRHTLHQVLADTASEG